MGCSSSAICVGERPSRVRSPTWLSEMALPDGNVIPGTGKSFELDFATSAKWENDQLVEEYVFWDSALMAQQIGLA